MKKYLNEDSIKIIISVILYIISLFIPNELIKIIILLLSYILISYEMYINAFKHIIKGKIFDENVLMIIASICAIAIKSYEEAVMVMVLFETGEYLADLAVDNSKKEITSLLDLRVETANLQTNNEIKKINIKNIKEGDILVVKPGEKIPLDGIIVEGSSHLDTSSLTGESIPKKVGKDDAVLSGCINNENIIKIKATATYKTTTTTKIIELIENSDEKKSTSEKFITKFASIYTPIVVLGAILLVLIPTLLGQDFNTWLYRALVFLVTSCPCALVISVPLGYFCGIGKSSKEGILIKGSNELDTLTNLDYIVLDKTGTITEGVFEVTNISPVDISEKELLRIAASAEEFSLHPIAKAIKEKNASPQLSVENYKEISGKGISCKINNQKILIGNEKLLKDANISVEKPQNMGSIVYIAIDNKYKGYIVISDKIKESSLNIHLLSNYINKNLVILSGDVEQAVKDVSKKVGINEYYASLLPQDKVIKVKELMKKGKVLFVGDGINDAPVLKLADTGVSMGQIGSDAAIEASDIVIMKDDLMKLKTSIEIAKYTKRNVIRTIIFALFVKTIVLILGALGISSIWMAVFADVGVTLLSILNVLRIMWKKFD